MCAFSLHDLCMVIIVIYLTLAWHLPKTQDVIWARCSKHFDSDTWPINKKKTLYAHKGIPQVTLFSFQYCYEPRILARNMETPHHRRAQWLSWNWTSWGDRSTAVLVSNWMLYCINMTSATSNNHNQNICDLPLILRAVKKNCGKVQL